jgi:hypothetical protein
LYTPYTKEEMELYKPQKINWVLINKKFSIPVSLSKINGN